MSIRGIAVVLAPKENIHHGDLIALVTDEDGSEVQAQQTLMEQFARTIVGHLFPDLDKNDAWAIWQLAQKNGYRIKQMPVTVSRIE